MTESNLMSYITFTFKTEAQMLLHIRLWEEQGKSLFAKLKERDARDIAIIRYGIKRELTRLQHYLSMTARKHIRTAKKLLMLFDRA